jgi:hypothetical protein
VEFRTLSESDKSMDDVLRVVLVKEGIDEVRFRKLSEADKKDISEGMVQSIIGMIKGKLGSVDFKEVEASKGDITKVPGYSDIEGSINLLVSMKSKAGNAPEEIAIVAEALKNLKANAEYFKKGFEQKNELVELLYNTVATGIVRATSILVASAVEYIKDPMGNFQPKFNESKIKFGGDSNLYFSNLSKFNTYARSGKLKSFFDNVGKLSESVTLAAIVGGIATAGAWVGLGVAVILLVIWLIREFIYLFFFAKTQTSIYLKNLSDFVSMNAATMHSPNMRVIREKQEAIAKRLMEWSEKIKVDNKITNGKAKEELTKENNQANFKTLSNTANFL